MNTSIAKKQKVTITNNFWLENETHTHSAIEEKHYARTW